MGAFLNRDFLKRYLAAIVFCCMPLVTLAQQATSNEIADPLAALLKSVVAISSTAVENAPSNAVLGRDRVGSGVVIDSEGHILTIGYLVIESESLDITLPSGETFPGRVVGYDHATGFALVKSILPARLQPVKLGNSAGLSDQELLIVLPYPAIGAGSATQLVSKRSFAGSWEYLLDSALYTFPPNPSWAGAGLLNEKGELVGLGSLFVRNTLSDEVYSPGNVFVPIDILKPILADLIKSGKRASRVHPWMGLTSDDSSGWVGILRVSRGGPAERAGIRPGDFITAVNGKEVRTLGEFYRTAWALGGPGTGIPVEVERNNRRFATMIESVDRTDFFVRPRGY